MEAKKEKAKAGQAGEYPRCHALKTIDLFAGCGGFAVGLREAGFEAVLAVDNDPEAVATYNRNLGGEFAPTDAADEEAIGEAAAKWRGKIDLITAGFPCQGFSLAGKRKADDPRNALWAVAAEWVDAVRPRMFIFENVRGIATMKTAEGTLVADEILGAMRAIGYECAMFTINAVSVGAPQSRTRAIFVGFNARNLAEDDETALRGATMSAEAKRQLARERLKTFVQLVEGIKATAKQRSA